MSLFFVNHGAELILDNLDATSRDYHWGLRTFASIDGVQSNYSTDGHIDVHGFTAAKRQSPAFKSFCGNRQGRLHRRNVLSQY